MMLTSLSALCTDFYINQKLSLKMDLPEAREAVLDMFDRVRREMPAMDRFRRYDGEFALESPDEHSQYHWLALRRTNIRSGAVNPQSVEQAYRLHRLILEIAPYFLSISPIDVEFLELVYGFDLEAQTNRNEVVVEALLGDSPLASMLGGDGEAVLEAQPFLGMCLNKQCDLQAFVEVKTRMRGAEIAERRFDEQPISVYLTVRQYGPIKSLEDLNTAFGALAGHIERLTEQRLIPGIIMPLRDRIVSR
jgi:hypothetical protein